MPPTAKQLRRILKQLRRSSRSEQLYAIEALRKFATETPASREAVIAAGGAPALLESSAKPAAAQLEKQHSKCWCCWPRARCGPAHGRSGGQQC